MRRFGGSILWLFTVVAGAVSACRSPASGAGHDEAAETRACSSGRACGASEYCDFDPGLCGKGTRAGTCRPRPTACDEAFAPVCGCDGKVYATECEARRAGADLAVNGGCHGGVPSYAPCGARFCDVRTSYCEIVLSDVIDPPTDYTCKPLPPSCIAEDGAEPTCDCFPKGTRCLSFCGPIDTGGGRRGLHLTCRL